MVVDVSVAIFWSPAGENRPNLGAHKGYRGEDVSHLKDPSFEMELFSSLAFEYFSHLFANLILYLIFIHVRRERRGWRVIL